MATFEAPKKDKKHVPCCPNHGEPLYGVPTPIPAKGKGICPVSNEMFEFEISLDAETVKYEKDHDGNLTAVPQYKLVGDESSNN